MQHPIIAKMPPELKEIRRKWLEADRQTMDVIYYREFAPGFARLFAELPLHGWRGTKPKFKALISVVGFSWQPIVLMAAWAKPDHLLLIGSKETLYQRVDGDSIQHVIEKISGFTESLTSFRQTEAEEELTIYREVRKFIEDYDLEPNEIAVDPTGGKKSMSISAGLAGFLSGAWIVYVDYAEYHPAKRIPLAGTEYPRLLENPLEVFGDLELRKVWEAFKAGNFAEAGHIAGDLSNKLYEPREANALVLLARGYGAWHQFQFETALHSLTQLKEYIIQFGKIGKWSWSGKLLSHLDMNLPALEELADITKKVCLGEKPDSLEKGMPLILNHLAASQRMLDYRQIGAAILLAYATLERYMDLCLWVYFNLDDEKPNFSKTDLDLSIFHKIGEKMYGKKRYHKNEPTGPIGLGLGVQLLATLKPDLLPVESVQFIITLMQHRNKCEFEHGLCPHTVKAKDVDRHLIEIRKLFRDTLKPMKINIDEELKKYHFPEL